MKCRCAEVRERYRVGAFPVTIRGTNNFSLRQDGATPSCAVSFRLRYARHLTPSTFGPYTFDHATPDTLADYMHFQNSLQHTQNPDDLRARLADGRTSYQHLCQMHSARGLEATWANGAGAGRIVVPHIRDGLEGSGLDALARHLAATAADKRLILDGERAPVQDAPWLAAGWVLDVHSAGASIDLSART